MLHLREFVVHPAVAMGPEERELGVKVYIHSRQNLQIFLAQRNWILLAGFNSQVLASTESGVHYVCRGWMSDPIIRCCVSEFCSRVAMRFPNCMS